MVVSTAGITVLRRVLASDRHTVEAELSNELGIPVVFRDIQVSHEGGPFFFLSFARGFQAAGWAEVWVFGVQNRHRIHWPPHPSSTLDSRAGTVLAECQPHCHLALVKSGDRYSSPGGIGVAFQSAVHRRSGFWNGIW